MTTPTNTEGATQVRTHDRAHQDRVLERMRDAHDTGEGHLTARQIASDIGSSRNYVARTLDDLAGLGLVRARREPGTDGHEWHLTSAGRS